MADLLRALGLAIVIEGLVLALAPLRYEELLAFLRSLSREARMLLGLTAIALGGVLFTLGGLVR
jgi:uncharacterized protein YjeT (DUF2065 family)